MTLAALICLAGCEGTDRLPEEYTQRLARSLEVDRQEIEDGKPPEMPRLRELRQPLTEATIDLLDFLALGGCELQGVIAERNSSLGRLATPTSQLVHELQFLASAGDCLASLEADDIELKETLQEAVSIKKQELPIVIFNATLGGEEFRAFWRPRGRPVAIDAEVIATLRALAVTIQGWLAGSYKVDREVLVSQLEVIRRGQGGDYVQYWFDLTRHLAAADRTIDARLDQRPLCFQNMRTQQAEIFHNVVMQFFIGGVQKEVALLSRGSFDLFAEVDVLEAALADALPDNYRRWRESRKAVVTEGSDSMSNHVRSLEPLLSSCGFLPTEG